MATINETAEYTSLQQALAGVSNGVQTEKDALNNAIARIDQSYADLLQLQQDFLPISTAIDDLVASDPDNQAYLNLQATKTQQISDFVALRGVASDMATAMDPFRAQ